MAVGVRSCRGPPIRSDRADDEPQGCRRSRPPVPAEWTCRPKAGSLISRLALRGNGRRELLGWNGGGWRVIDSRFRRGAASWNRRRDISAVACFPDRTTGSPSLGWPPHRTSVCRPARPSKVSCWRAIDFLWLSAQWISRSRSANGPFRSEEPPVGRTRLLGQAMT